MVSKQVRAKRTTKPQNHAARTVWLAGLGAVSLARKQGGRLVETLVDEGEQFRARSEKLVATLARDAGRRAKAVRERLGRVRGQLVDYIEPVQKRAAQAARRVETQVGSGLDALLARAGVPANSRARSLVARATRIGKTTARRPATRARRAR